MNVLNPLQRVKKHLEEYLPGSQVEVSDLTGTQDHIGLLVVSDEFKGKPLLEQHQMVMDLLRQGLQEYIHAVQIKTMTKEAFLKKKMNP